MPSYKWKCNHNENPPVRICISENLRPLDGIYIAAMDARRDQLYTATFENNGDVITRLCDDRAISIAELAEEIKTYKDKRIYAAGDGYDALISGLKKHGIEILKTPPQLINESADSVALVAKRKFEAGEYTALTMQHKVIENGKKCAPEYTLMEKKAYYNETLMHFSPSERRLINPHYYKVDISDDLYNLKMSIINKIVKDIESFTL